MCQPCRSELYTGQYPIRNGCAWNHSASRPGLSSMPQHLEPKGYRVGLAGKVHVRPAAVFPFKQVPGFAPNCVRNLSRLHAMAGIRPFMTGKKPVCLGVGWMDPHERRVMGYVAK